MLTRIFRLPFRKLNANPSYHNKFYELLKKNFTKREKNHAILVMNKDGIPLGSLVTKSYIENALDDNLMSMFISAISNFTRELFKRKGGTSICINKGENLIAIESNEIACVAFIGEYNPQTLYLKLSSLLSSVEEVLRSTKKISDFDNELLFQELIKQVFIENE